MTPRSVSGIGSQSESIREFLSSEENKNNVYTHFFLQGVAGGLLYNGLYRHYLPQSGTY